MTRQPPTPAADTGVALLERALGYTLGSLAHVTYDHLHLPTTCADWDLADLLRHMDDSLLALTETAGGSLTLTAPVPEAPGSRESLIEPAANLRNRACLLLGAWTEPTRPSEVAIGSTALHSDILAGAGALEVTVHGWDVARSIGYDHPVPPALAEDLLMLAALLVTPLDRPGRFAAPVPVSAGADFGDQLVAFLGRDPAVTVAP